MNNQSTFNLSVWARNTNTLAPKLLNWIRKNKKELYNQEVVDKLPEEKRKGYRDFINQLAYFDRRYRGSQHWLRSPGESLPKWNAPDSYYYSNARSAALKTLGYAANLVSLPETALWDSFYEELGCLDQRDFESLHATYLEDIYWMARPADASIDSNRGTYTITIKRGVASNTFKMQRSVTPEGLSSLKEQLAFVEAEWQKLKKFAKDIYEDPKSRPTNKDIEILEEAQAEDLATAIVKRLSPAERALLAKHPKAINQLTKALKG